MQRLYLLPVLIDLRTDLDRTTPPAARLPATQHLQRRAWDATPRLMQIIDDPARFPTQVPREL